MGPTVHGRFSQHLSTACDSNSYRRPAPVHRLPVVGDRFRSDGADQGLLEQPDLHAARHPVGLSQSDPPLPDHSCRAAVARLIANRVSQVCRHAVRRQERTVRRENVCRWHSSPPWPVGWGKLSMRAWIPNGSGKAAASSSSTDRRSRCPTRRRRTIPDLQPETGNGVRLRADRSDHLALVRSDSRSGDLPVRGERTKRVGAASAVVGPVSSRRRSGRRPPHVPFRTEMVMLKQRGVICLSVA